MPGVRTAVTSRESGIDAKARQDGVAGSPGRRHRGARSPPPSAQTPQKQRALRVTDLADTD